MVLEIVDGLPAPEAEEEEKQMELDFTDQYVQTKVAIATAAQKSLIKALVLNGLDVEQTNWVMNVIHEYMMDNQPQYEPEEDEE